MKVPRILVTGGAGFLGSALVAEALAQGGRVTVLDDLSTGRLSNLSAWQDAPGFEFVQGSVTDEALVERLVAAHERVLHMAAVVGVRLVLAAPARTVETNVTGSLNVLRAAARHGREVLLASTSEVYGRREPPFREEAAIELPHPEERRWIYAATKALSERTAFALARSEGLRVLVVRFFNTVGARQRGRYGMVLPNFVRQALAGEPLTVFGDGTQTRSFLAVQDAVRAVGLLLETERAWGQVVNVGSDEEVSILELAQRVVSVTGSRSPIVRMPYREAYGIDVDDIPRRRPALERLAGWTGFRPHFDLDGILREVVAAAPRRRARALEPGR